MISLSVSPSTFLSIGRAEYHDYHHYVGGQSQTNFASVFAYCHLFIILFFLELFKVDILMHSDGCLIFSGL